MTVSAKRDAELVSRADAVVVVCDREPGVHRLLELVEAKGIPLHVIGGEEPVKVKRIKPPLPEARHGLPD